MKVGITSAELDRLRDNGKQPPPRPADPQTPTRQRTREMTPSAESKLTLLEGVRLARRGATQPAAVSDHISPTSSGTPAIPPQTTAAPPPVGTTPPADALQGCFATGADDAFGRVYNRFAYCQRVDIVANYWEFNSRGVPVEKKGTTTATVEIFAQGDNQNRRVRVFARIQQGSVSYDWGPYENLFVAPDVPLSMYAKCPQDFQVCQGTRSPATMSWAAWDNNTQWFYWDVYNNAPGAGRDKISYNQWNVQLFTEGEQYETQGRAKTNLRMVRCDSATYFKQGRKSYPHACVFAEVIPHLNYQIDSPHGAVAQHIFAAQNTPSTTYPLLVPAGEPQSRNKRIPGKYVPGTWSAGLHRITESLHPDAWRANERHKNNACRSTGQYADTGLPTPPKSGEDCDEYPFRSTLEGASNSYWDFSVRAVPQSDNRRAGGILNNYYVNDRILAWDATLPLPDITNDTFYVNIE